MHQSLTLSLEYFLKSAEFTKQFGFKSNFISQINCVSGEPAKELQSPGQSSLFQPGGNSLEHCPQSENHCKPKEVSERIYGIYLIDIA